MYALVKIYQYGAINTTDTTKMGYYRIKFISEPYKLKEETMCYEQTSTDDELFFKSQCMTCIQDNTKGY